MTGDRPTRQTLRPPAVLAWASALTLAATAAAGFAAEPTTVPPNLQAAIFSRVLALDGALKTRGGKTVTIGVLYAGTSEDSKQARQRMVRAFSDAEKDIQDLPSRLVSHDYHDAKHLAAWIDSYEVDVLYVTIG